MLGLWSLLRGEVLPQGLCVTGGAQPWHYQEVVERFISGPGGKSGHWEHDLEGDIGTLVPSSSFLSWP